MNFLKYIFSTKPRDPWHNTITILGIKINVLKSECIEKRKEIPFDYYKENNIDITTIPPATGQLRDIQLAHLALLQELDYVCKENNLKYWLMYGSLLGAIRHKGFIPWDDDIDVNMLREDYEKIIDAFKKSSRNPDILADYVRSGKYNYFIKIQHKKCPHLLLDIFPNDYYPEELSFDEELEKTKEIKQLSQKMYKEAGSEPTLEKLLATIDKYKKELLGDKPSDKKEIVWGLEFTHQWKSWFNKLDEIFPLQEIEFENHKFLTVNKPDVVLNKIYGDYMEYPEDIRGHSMLFDISEEEQNAINDLIKDLK